MKEVHCLNKSWIRVSYHILRRLLYNWSNGKVRRYMSVAKCTGECPKEMSGGGNSRIPSLFYLCSLFIY